MISKLSDAVSSPVLPAKSSDIFRISDDATGLMPADRANLLSYCAGALEE